MAVAYAGPDAVRWIINNSTAVFGWGSAPSNQLKLELSEAAATRGFVPLLCVLLHDMKLLRELEPTKTWQTKSLVAAAWPSGQIQAIRWLHDCGFALNWQDASYQSPELIKLSSAGLQWLATHSPDRLRRDLALSAVVYDNLLQYINTIKGAPWTQDQLHTFMRCASGVSILQWLADTFAPTMPQPTLRHAMWSSVPIFDWFRDQGVESALDNSQYIDDALCNVANQRGLAMLQHL